MYYCKGWTPLMAAAHGGHEATVKSLINHGANVDVKNNLGKFFSM